MKIRKRSHSRAIAPDIMTKARKHLEEAGESPLKKLRDGLGMSQEEFARQIGTSVRTVSRP